MDITEEVQYDDLFDGNESNASNVASSTGSESNPHAESRNEEDLKQQYLARASFLNL